MSYTFSRRAFFKYSAAAVVAVAGMSLLGGCTNGDPNNPVATAVGKSLSIVNVDGTLETEGTAVESGIFRFTVKNNNGTPILLSPNNFSVSVRDVDGKTVKYYSLNEGGVQLSGLTDSSVASGKTATFVITAHNFPQMAEGESVILKYFPVTTSVYSNYSMAWHLKKEPAAQ